jgi:hypothetical protein
MFFRRIAAAVFALFLGTPAITWADPVGTPTQRVYASTPEELKRAREWIQDICWKDPDCYQGALLRVYELPQNEYLTFVQKSPNDQRDHIRALAWSAKRAGKHWVGIPTGQKDAMGKEVLATVPARHIPEDAAYGLYNNPGNPEGLLDFYRRHATDPAFKKQISNATGFVDEERKQRGGRPLKTFEIHNAARGALGLPRLPRETKPRETKPPRREFRFKFSRP